MSRWLAMLALSLPPGCDREADLEALRAIYDQHRFLRDGLRILADERQDTEQAWQEVQAELKRRRARDPSYSQGQLVALAARSSAGAQVSQEDDGGLVVEGEGGAEAYCPAFGRMARQAPLVALVSTSLAPDGHWEYRLATRRSARGLRPSEVKGHLQELPPVPDLHGTRSTVLREQITTLKGEIGTLQADLGGLLQLPVRQEALRSDAQDDDNGDRMKRVSWVVEGMFCGEQPPLGSGIILMYSDRLTFRGRAHPERHLGEVAMGASWWVIDRIEGLPEVTGTLHWEPLEGEPEPPAAGRPVAGGGWAEPAWARQPSGAAR